jgi:small-conductance mechanosensitive channel
VAATVLPLRALCMAVTTYMLLRVLELPDDWLNELARITRALSIAAIVWGMVRSLYALADAVANGALTRETNDPERLARARALHTQIIVANRVVSVLVIMVGSAAVALQFEAVRAIGVSLLASAGVAGIFLGFAAQKSLSALLAGLQLSVSQPIRLGDSVVMQGEFGTIEDIGLTYVTVRLWDERRLIVPTPRFLEQPFENWSRANAGLLGTVLLRVDYQIPLVAVRTEFERVVREEPLWDGHVQNLQVTDAGEQSLEVRLMMSARTPGMLWNLRVAVREKLVAWLQDYKQGVHLPHRHVVVTQSETDGAET